ncbi:MAG: thiol-disulfide oxidoreductase DCC family protein [Thermodesulfobacteriota bacterium]
MPIPEVDHSVIIFDGVCNLCNGAVNFIIDRDPSARFQFAPIQSSSGNKILKALNLFSDNLDSIILIEDGKHYIKSTAALRICKKLGALWPLLYIFILIPRPIRDYFYDIVAKNRYGWFGKREKCMMPNTEIESRFLN